MLHPNICTAAEGGYVCLNIFDEEWNPEDVTIEAGRCLQRRR